MNEDCTHSTTHLYEAAPVGSIPPPMGMTQVLFQACLDCVGSYCLRTALTMAV